MEQLIRILGGFPIQLLILTLIVSNGLPRRPYCALRQLALGLPLLLIYDMIAYSVAPSIAGLEKFERPALLLPVIYLIGCMLVWYRCKWEEGMFCVIAAAIAQNMVYNLYWLLQFLLGFEDGNLFSLGISALLMVVMALFSRFVLNRRLILDRAVSINKIKLCICSCTVLSMTAFFSPRLIETSDRIYVYLCYILMDALALMFQFGMLYEGGLEQKNEIMEQLLHAEQKKHAMTKENIEIINRKCHDLKHQIGALKRMGPGEQRDAYIQEIEKAVMIYGSAIRTGSDTLNLILMEKMLLCQNNQIQLSCISDGGNLDFMNSVDMYTLFGNALDNAMESVMKVSPEYRIISLKIAERGGMVSVHLENYTEGTPRMVNGFPATTKQGRHYHGFGILSMKHIVDKYKGDLSITVKNNMFCVDILFPAQSAQKSGRNNEQSE